MRVLLVNDVCWSGGVESQMAALASGLAAKGHTVSAFFYTPGPGAHLFDGACECITGPRPSLGEHICNFDPDVVSTNLSTLPLGFLRTIRRIGYTGGLAATCHGTVFEGWPRDKERHATVAVSEHVAGLVRGLLQVEPAVIYNGIDSNVFTQNGPTEPSDAPVLLWVGRSDDPNKDFAGFTAAASRFIDQGWSIWIADGAVNPRTNTLCEWLGHKCRLFRDVSTQRMAMIYRGVGLSGGCLLSTSQSEAFGLAVVEAMACGCPVVVPAVGGLRELLIDGECGLVYDRSDGAGRVCERIAQMSTNALRDDLILQAQARVSKSFTREAMVLGYEKLFASIAQPRHFVWWGRKTASRAMLAALRVGRTICK